MLGLKGVRQWHYRYLNSANNTKGKGKGVGGGGVHHLSLIAFIAEVLDSLNQLLPGTRRLSLQLTYIRSTFDVLIGVLSHMIKCQNVPEIPKITECSILHKCTYSRAKIGTHQACLHHFLLNMMVSGFLSEHIYRFYN